MTALMSTSFRKVFTYQLNHPASAEVVFPLFSPEREVEWLDGIAYQLIYSDSRSMESDAVYASAIHTERPSFGIVNYYNPEDLTAEFIQFNPDNSLVKISIKVNPIDMENCSTHVAHQFTALNVAHIDFLENHMEDLFQQNMAWREKSINFYIQNGKKLSRQS
ncbi:MAG: hypothetical protein AAFO07_30505 [Bacteroidota bacterium]